MELEAKNDKGAGPKPTYDMVYKQGMPPFEPMFHSPRRRVPGNGHHAEYGRARQPGHHRCFDFLSYFDVRVREDSLCSGVLGTPRRGCAGWGQRADARKKLVSRYGKFSSIRGA